jgi:hypothetical protein
MDDTESRELTRTSIISGTTRTIVVTAPASAWQLYDGGTLIQHALPMLSAAQREFLMTGITAEEWDEMCAVNDDQ